MPFARTKDRATSHKAAQSVRNVSDTQQCILDLLTFPMTDETLVELYRASDAPYASESGIRSRRSELVALGLVKSVGFAKSLSNRSMNVWAKA